MMCTSICHSVSHGSPAETRMADILPSARPGHSTDFYLIPKADHWSVHISAIGYRRTSPRPAFVTPTLTQAGVPKLS